MEPAVAHDSVNVAISRAIASRACSSRSRLAAVRRRLSSASMREVMKPHSKAASPTSIMRSQR